MNNNIDKFIEQIEKEMDEIKKYINLLEIKGIYTEWQNDELEFNKNRLIELQNKLK